MNKQLELPTSWEVPKELRVPDYTTCPYIRGEIRLTQKAFSKITALMAHFNVEWLGYLIGTWQDGDTVLVKDLVIPEQQTTGSSVHEVDERAARGSIGVIHSHVAMGAFFSGTDDTWINNNHNVSIVVSKKNGVDKLDFKSQVRKQVACGAMMLMDLPVRVVEVSQKSWLEGIVDRVKAVVYAPVVKNTPTFTFTDWQRNKNKANAPAPYGLLAGAIMPNPPPTEEDTADLKTAYEKCVAAVAKADTTKGVVLALWELGDDDLENAVLFIDTHSQGEAQSDLADLFETELTRRIREAAKSVGVEDYHMYGG